MTTQKTPSILLDGVDQEVMDRADAADAARVLVLDHPIGAIGTAPGQHADQFGMALSDEVVNGPYPDPGAHGLELADCAGALEARGDGPAQLRHVVERRGIVERQKYRDYES